MARRLDMTFGVRPMKRLLGAVVFWLGAKAALMTGRLPLAAICTLATYGMCFLAILALMGDVKDWYDDE